MIAFVFVLAWLAMTLAGDTPIGCALRRAFIAWPARQLNKLCWRDCSPLLVVAVVGVAVFYLLDGEALIIFGLATPEILAFAAMFEISTLADVIAFVVMAGSSMRLPIVVQAIRTMFAPRARRRAHRPHRHAPANDDDDRRSWARAA